ncbi:DUF2092 domain-containing protein [Algoriphagus kandeliae]|uniref:DUF2092 domain-containing protein n=1 Tax=Algoriphagus kandeliae TaxID=2562278 RepID=A0A4Y9QYV3_9BACT|nr:DUF2092 domain-containing protein [Algoriphagus kandeliae]TFV97287.1 DUF2092 domain-containing protein [Algoriphagus kandeliae]
MKKLFTFVLGIFLSQSLQAQSTFHDSTALLILDKVSEYFGQLNSVKFNTKISEDVAFSDNFFIKEFRNAEFIFQDNNKMAAKISNQDKDKFFFYNGQQAVYFAKEDNYFTVADAPDNTLEMLDWLDQSFGVHLLFADFLYPDFTLSLVENMDYLEFLGTAYLDGIEYYHIGGANADLSFQLWIHQDLEMKPKKVVLTYFGEPYARQMEVNFDNWESNEIYPQTIFEFLPPPNSRQIIWLQKNQ